MNNISFCESKNAKQNSELVQTSSLSTFHQVMHVYVRTFKGNPLHDCIALVLDKELCMGDIHVLWTHF